MMPDDPQRFAPLAEGELEAWKRATDLNRGVALDRVLDVLERTLDERDRQTKKAVDLLTENAKLKGLAADALDLLEDREWMVEGGSLNPPQNFCEACGAGEVQPKIPVHEPDCRWVKTVKALRELVPKRPDGPSPPRLPMHLENLLMGVVYVARGPRTVERPKGEVFGLPSVLRRRCDYVAGPFRNTILANGWVEKHIDPDDRSDIILVGTVEEVEWKTG